MQQIYNSLTRKKETFVPIEAGKVSLYACGPTVYDYFHIGNARTFAVFDMVARWLSTTGFEVCFVRNITDIEDRIIDRANQNQESISALTERMTAAMFADADRLGLQRPSKSPRATEHIDHMLALIERLVEKGIAYRAENGDVFYKVREFEGYGKLSGRNLDDLRAGERVAVDTHKQDPLDFVLWKAAKPLEPFWPSKFGNGRPGWHIECSAMCKATLGETIDIHGGGWDLQFPHHENEIAQSEAANDKPFARYWMHAAFLNIDQEKMSKSLGNFFTLREVLDKLDAVQGGETVRYFLLRGHYRSEINYSWETLEEARQTLLAFYITLKDIAPQTTSIDWSNTYAAQFKAALDDDFNTPMAFAVLHDLRGEVNKTRDHGLAGLLKALGGTLGFLQTDPETFLRGAQSEDIGVEERINQRAAAKAARDFAKADAIRRELEEAGIVLEDRPGGKTEWRRK